VSASAPREPVRGTRQRVTRTGRGLVQKNERSKSAGLISHTLEGRAGPWDPWPGVPRSRFRGRFLTPISRANLRGDRADADGFHVGVNLALIPGAERLAQARVAVAQHVMAEFVRESCRTDGTEWRGGRGRGAGQQRHLRQAARSERRIAGVPQDGDSQGPRNCLLEEFELLAAQMPVTSQPPSPFPSCTSHSRKPS
jgi:hypothetical protein